MPAAVAPGQADGAPEAAEAPVPAGLGRTLATLGVDLAAPIALYYLLHGLGVSNLVALGAGAVLPALGATYELATERRADGVALLVLATMAASVAVSIAAHGPRFLLAKDGLITGAWGAWFLASVRARRPAAFLFARPLMGGRSVFAAGSWDLLWDGEPRFRRIWRVVSVMWAVGLLADAALRVVMAYALPVDVVPGLGDARCTRSPSWCSRSSPTSTAAVPASTGSSRRAGFAPTIGVPAGRSRAATTPTTATGRRPDRHGRATRGHSLVP